MCEYLCYTFDTDNITVRQLYLTKIKTTTAKDAPSSYLTHLREFAAADRKRLHATRRTDRGPSDKEGPGGSEAAVLTRHQDAPRQPQHEKRLRGSPARRPDRLGHSANRTGHWVSGSPGQALHTQRCHLCPQKLLLRADRAPRKLCWSPDRTSQSDLTCRQATLQ